MKSFRSLILLGLILLALLTLGVLSQLEVFNVTRSRVLHDFWVFVGYLCSVIGCFFLLLGIVGRGRPLPSWSITTTKRANVTCLFGYALLVEGTFLLDSSLSFTLIGLVVFPLAIFLLSFVLSFGMVWIGWEVERENARRLAAHFEKVIGSIRSFLLAYYKEGRWEELDWQNLYSQYVRWSEAKGFGAASKSEFALFDFPNPKAALPHLINFLESQCHVGAKESVGSDDLYQAYKRWAVDRGDATLYPQREFERFVHNWTGAIKAGRLWTLLEQEHLGNRLWFGIGLASD